MLSFSDSEYSSDEPVESPRPVVSGKGKKVALLRLNVIISGTQLQGVRLGVLGSTPGRWGNHYRGRIVDCGWVWGFVVAGDTCKMVDSGSTQIPSRGFENNLDQWR
jgi:hypothetical protein